MDFSIIIVNWNTKELLKKCLDSILNYGGKVKYEIIIVDNNSKDGSRELITNYKLQITNLNVILNNSNLGFAAAVNQGVKISKGKYILLLNSDTQIKEDTLVEIAKFMIGCPEAGIVGGKILNNDGSVQASIRNFPTLLSQILILLKFHHFFKDLSLKKYFAVNFDYSKVQEVDQAMGAFFVINKKLLDEIGLFDEKFFVWFEEVDFCKRAKDAAWKIYYYPGAEIIHHGSASFSQILSLKNQWQFNRSLLYYFKKHLSSLSYLIILFLTPLSLFLAFLTSIFPFLRKLKKI